MSIVQKYASIGFVVDSMRVAAELPITGSDTDAEVEAGVLNLVAQYGITEFDVLMHYSVVADGSVAPTGAVVNVVDLGSYWSVKDGTQSE